MSVLKPIVIYHNHCMDGMAAAWCFWDAFGDKMEYFPGEYQGRIPDIVDRDVYLVDFSYKRADMAIICRFASKVVLLDHHKTALEDLKGLDDEYPNLEMHHSTQTLSGAGIAWNYVRQLSEKKRLCPPFLLHVQDRDLWEFKLAGTKEIIKAAEMASSSLDAMDAFMSYKGPKLDTLRKQGAAMLASEQRLIRGIVSGCERRLFVELSMGVYNLPLINAPGALFSEMGDIIGSDPECKGVAMYYDTAMYRVFGLRSNKKHGADVSLLALHFGGGGHKNAAGFKVPRNHYLARM